MEKPFERLLKTIDSFVHLKNSKRKLIIRSDTPDAARFLLDSSLGRFPGIRVHRTSYIQSRLVQSKFRCTRSFLQQELMLASLVPGQVVIIEGLDMFCPEEGANEAVLEEFLYWLDGGLVGQLVIVLVGIDIKANLLLEGMFQVVELPALLEASDRIWVLTALNDKFSLGMATDQISSLSQELKSVGFEDLYRAIIDRYTQSQVQQLPRADQSWNLVKGQEIAKQRLAAATRFLWDSDVLAKYLEVVKISPNIGVLLHGPPGTGKTLLAKEIASLHGVHFHSATVPELVHAEIGQSEASLAALFEWACAHQPAIIFIDELEAIFSSGSDQHSTGRKLLSQLILEFDRLYSDLDFKRVLVIGASNRLDIIDPALLRFGRFGEAIAVEPEPGFKAAADIIRSGLAVLDEDLVESKLLDEGHIESILEEVYKDVILSGADAAQILEEVKRAGLHRRAPINIMLFSEVVSNFNR